MGNEQYAIEMLNITKRFPGIIANDNITLQLRHGEIHALLGENGAGKSTLMSVLFGLYQAEEGIIKKDGVEVKINDPNDANALGIGMVHQHFKLVECFTVLENIILGVEPNKAGFLQKDQAREKVMKLSEQYGLHVDPDALIEDITVGMQQRTEILKMLYRDNEILIFDEPTAVLTPQEIEELMDIMRGLAEEGKSILFISHKLNEIMAVADRCTVLRKGKYIGTVDIKNTTKEELSRMMVGRDVEFAVHKEPAKPGKPILEVKGLTVASKLHHNNALKQVVFAQGRWNRAYTHLATALFLAQMLLACIACAQAVHRRDTSAAPLFLTLLGAFLFLCIWETRARYFFQFMMVLLCAGAMFAPKRAD